MGNIESDYEYRARQRSIYASNRDQSTSSLILFARELLKEVKSKKKRKHIGKFIRKLERRLNGKSKV